MKKYKIGRLLFLVIAISVAFNFAKNFSTLYAQNNCPLNIQGDANNDCKIDGIDYVIWLNNYNKTVTNGSVSADFNNDTFVDGLDYVIWLSNFGKSATHTPTPSPTSQTPTASPTLISDSASYVGCDTNASDTNSGLSPQSSWKTLSRATSGFTGQILLLQRGCTWTNQSLTISANGTASQNILIDAYGNGNLPIIEKNTDGPALSLQGSYITVQNLYLQGKPSQPPVLCGSSNISIGRVTGIAIANGKSQNTIRNIEAAGFYAAVEIKNNASNNRILNNYLHDNNMLLVSGGDSGAFGVLIHGDHNEIAYNRIENNDVCSPDYGRDGSAVEIYGDGGNGASFNNIHHNTTKNVDSFAELGKSSSSEATDNIFAYNQYVYTSPSNHGIFLVTRGAGDGYGPILRTILYNNTAFMTGNFKQGLVCYAGCDATILKMRNNIIQKSSGAISTDRSIDEDYNLFVGPISSLTGPLGSHSQQSTSTNFAQFVNITTEDFRLQPGSPAINSGTIESVESGYNSDLNYPPHSVPGGTAVDIGAYEN